MTGIIEKMKVYPDFCKLGSVSEESIIEAETQLGVMFSDEYKTYISAFGTASMQGHEFTGICKSPRLNVVDVTQSERKDHPDISNDLYVIEQLNIDGIIIWQTQSGEVFQTARGGKPQVIAASLSAYLDL